MRHLAITGMETAAMISRIFLGAAMRATPPSARICAGTRSSAITATAPAFSAISACSLLVTSIMTPPLSISARPVLRRRLVELPLFCDIFGLFSGTASTDEREGALGSGSILQVYGGRKIFLRGVTPCDSVPSVVKTLPQRTQRKTSPQRTLSFTEERRRGAYGGRLPFFRRILQCCRRRPRRLCPSSTVPV